MFSERRRKMEFVAGLILGLLIGLIAWRRPFLGTLKIDHSDPEKDLYRFEIEDLDGLSKRRAIRLKVTNTADLSQE
jgi:hypothetical protein